MTGLGAKISFALSCVAMLSIAAPYAQADIPALMSYQGRLQNSQGAPLDGIFDIAFAIYDVASGGTALWTESQSVVVNEGFFNVLLGAVEPIPSDLFGATVRYLGVKVGADPEMVPRRQIVTAAYAQHAQSADIAAGIEDGAIVDADVSPSANISPTKIAGTALTSGGNNNFSGTTTFLDSAMVISNNKVVIGRSMAPAGDDVLALKRSLATTASSSGARIDIANSGTGQIFGLASTANGSGNLAVGIAGSGTTDGDSAVGVYGEASASSSNIGVYGTVSGDIGTKIGVQGEISSGFNVTGVKGSVSGSSGAASGVFGHAISCSDGYGIRGVAEGNFASGRAVDGSATLNSGSGYGVVGRASDNGGSGYGVYGIAGNNAISNWAGYFSGDVNVTGNIFIPSLITQIDHPLDPENQILRLAGVDSPEMKTIYDGIVTTNANGEAIVTMPTYFDALNDEFRYQLTVIGEFAQVIVLKKLDHGRFTIKTEKPNLEVSWQVTGVRRDAFATANPLVVESQKRQVERGLYLHPEAFGLTRDRGVDALRSPKTEAPTIDADLMPEDSDQ